MKRLIQNFVGKYNSLSLQLKAAAWFTICNIIQKGISTITVPIFTRLMTMEQYGTYTVYLSWQSILLIFTSLNLYYGVFNNAMIKYKESRKQYVSSMQGLTFTITCFFFFIYIVFQEALNQFLGMSSLLVYLLFAQLLSMPALLFWTAHQRFEYRYKALVGVTLLKAFLNPVLGVIAVYASTYKDVARISTVVLVEVLIGGSIAIYQFYKGKSFFNKLYWKYAFLFNLPLLPHYLSGTILNQSDRIMISQMIGKSQTALYGVAYNVGMLMLLFTDAINNSFTPWMYHKMKDKMFSDIRRVSNILFVFISMLVVMLLFFAPEIIYFFAGIEYADATYVIPPVAVSTFMIFSYNFFANVEFYYEENKMIMIASVAAALLNLLLNWIFIPIFGYYVAGYTTLFCYIVYTFSHYFFSRLVLRKHDIYEDAFDLKTLILITIFLMILVIIFNFLYEYHFIRYILFVIFIMAVFLKRKLLVGTLALIKEK